uniref:Uncharacterized protein n=1 Tax=Meloidogyne incognita TaxID=6306 RepID=A0A914KKW0_MELIC
MPACLNYRSVNVPIEALGVYSSMGPIGWASIRAWSSIGAGLLLDMKIEALGYED